MLTDLQPDRLTNNSRPRSFRGAARLRSEIAVSRRAGRLNSGNDRAISSRDAAAVARSCLPNLGITRLARVTGLDRIGVPVWTAIRPNALSLSVSQGKGIDDDAAVASAIFEAAELTVAEREQPCAFQATLTELAESRPKFLDATRYLRRGARGPTSDERVSWIEGLDLLSGDAVLVPEDVARIADVPGCRYWQTSDGLGTGSNILEAAIHGICEIVERDAMALWSLKSDADVGRCEIAIGDLDSDEIEGIADQITSAGLRVRLFDATSDTLVPTYLAVLMEKERPDNGVRFVDVASGSGTHPVAARAALRAITEAAQTRLTTITGSRDDVDPREYGRLLSPDLRVYVGSGVLSPNRVMTVGYSGERSLPSYLDWLIERVRAVGVRTLALVELAAPDFPFMVARAIAPDLEQDPRSGNRRPGSRFLSALLGVR